MTAPRRILAAAALLSGGLTAAWTCGFDDTLREYLNVEFWLPFVKHGRYIVRDGDELWSPFAGMVKASGDTPLERLRAAYQEIASPDTTKYDAEKLARTLAAARAAPMLTARDRDEVELIDAKIDLRAGSPAVPEPLRAAKQKLERYLRTARTPEYLSEGRGWLAHVHYRLGDQTAAGKIYLDELQRSDSNLGRDTLLKSLKLTYGYDGGPKLLEHLDEYFDTPEHAAFAIRLVTNPKWNRRSLYFDDPNQDPIVTASPPYTRITALLQRHHGLFRSPSGSALLASLGMRTALRAGDPRAALRIAANVPPRAPVRNDPDFNWMLRSARFLTRDYAGAEQPLLRLFRSQRSSDDQKCAAAYGLCGVYRKTGNFVEQIRMALWLHTDVRRRKLFLASESGIGDMSVYWASSGWDLNLLLDIEAPLESLEAFVKLYPHVPDARLVRYATTVRLARQERYDEAAEIYQAIDARRRAARMRTLASLHRDASNGATEHRLDARYKYAEFLAHHPERIYFNDALWSGLQRYALIASRDSRLTRDERQTLIADERKLKDDQEERWRAYLILRDVMKDAGPTELGRRAAKLAIECLRRINPRFGREQEIRAGELELSAWLRAPR